MQRNLWLIAIGVIITLVLINNTVYYFLTKATLEEGHRQELLTLANQIEIAVEQSRMGAEHYEEQIGRELRTASIAAQYALDPDVEKVNAEQLQELSKKLDIAHITLLKKTADDIVLYRSSDESQLGKSTKSWDPWHKVFQQLFAQEAVKEEWLGQTMQNFWSGPFEVSSTELDKVYKWGYYYDGTTNYLIDPYVKFANLDEYNRITGAERLISELESNSDSILEIAAINPATFPDGVWTLTDEGKEKEHLVQRPVIYGNYTVKSDRDEELVRKAYRNHEIVTLEDKAGGKHIYKLFIPVYVKDKGIKISDEYGKQLDSYVLTIASDYEVIQRKLDNQFLNLGLIILFLSIASVMIAYVALRYYKYTREKAVQVAQETYTEEINSLFHSIKAQRHDFLNHVQTIHSLAELNKQKELVAYTKELTGEIRSINEYINIGNPAIAALIRSKISQAESYRIRFECSFNGLELQGMGGKTLDMNRILGNLIDNAFDEVLKYEESLREVELIVTQSKQVVEIIISNRCLDAELQARKPLFKAGFSTKQDGHQGLGLSIVKSIADRCKGEVAMDAPAPDQIKFTVRIPL
ncbi:GHKL domain-containing protein [Paenibacillus sp. LHD-117]|uniref:sensor histidine kinase n=1 Tax=Paenibacillus sp. LHD-117 TaxID=3071412 RepID=UPI0027E00447|nr:GHKL domain-containing protein [Paenibacillus sp. LHD-117]MDQ6418352.1 GHKL domain-containing protein [Paenibacillus sp. LHD-117]